MKKFLLLVFTLFLVEANAQCPVTVNGQSSGGGTNICSGTCFTLAAAGANTYTWMPGGIVGDSAYYCPSSTTTYTVIGTNSGGTCTDTAIFSLQVITPSVTASASPNSLCVGDTTTLCASGAAVYTWSPGNTSNCMYANPSSYTCYTVTGTDFMGCISSAVVCVQVNTPPTVSFSLSNIAPQVWDATLSYTGNPIAYAWSWGDGNYSTVQHPTHTYTVAGWYNICVTITDANGCIANFCQLDSVYKSNSTNSMITVNVVSGTTGVASHTKNSSSFSPNPAAEQLIINEGASAAEIFDISGKMVLNRKINGKTTLNISHLPEGVYFIRLKNGEAWESKKLVIVH